MGGKLLFCLDARVEFNGQERDNITKYKLGSMCIYNSEASKKHLAAAAGNMATGNAMGSLKAIGSYALAAINLNITIDGLSKGTHVECKDMDELLGAEEAVVSACENLKAYLAAAATFDGREILMDFSGAEPTVAAPSQASLAPPPAPVLPPPIVQMATPAPEPSQQDPTPPPAMEMAMSSSGPMRPDTTFTSDEPSPVDKFSEWWGNLTGQQKGFTVAGAFVVFYILSKIL